MNVLNPRLQLATLPAFIMSLAGLAAAEPAPLHPVVIAEETVYQPTPSDNGSSPMWCHGSTCLVRVNDRLFASGVETLPEIKTYNNVRWLLFERGDEGWRQVAADPKDHTREPSPLACFHDGSLFMSVNPTISTDPVAKGGPAKPTILRFNPDDPAKPSAVLLPEWAGTPAFTEHSYRSFAADGARGELILFQNIGYDLAEWAYRNAEGAWEKQGQLKWPWGDTYPEPKPVRVCYPNVMLKDGAVHFCGVSDVTEPNPAWRDFKRELTGQQWDYDFRRLFYTWSPDIRTGEFRDWIEIASRDETCGWISPGDLWVAPDGDVHIVWTERALDLRLRDKFFPDAKQRNELNHAVIRNGEVVKRNTIMAADEGTGPQVIASQPRFQVTPDNRLFLFYHAGGTDENGTAVSENRVLEISADDMPGTPVTVPMTHPMNAYFTATVRAGSEPSNHIDLLGNRAGDDAMSYARVRLVE